jgi:hypothetical protein
VTAFKDAFRGVFGHVSADPTLHRAVRRVKGMAAHGASPSDISRDLARLGVEQAGGYYEPDYRDEYQQPEPDRADRQRENLRAFVDVRELVRGWRTGNISWDTEAWGPDPNDPACLVPWDVLREAS